MKTSNFVKAVRAAILFTPVAALVGCLDGVSTQNGTGESAAAGNKPSNGIQSQPIFGQEEQTYRDAETGLVYFKDKVSGESYLLNPNWSRLGAEGSAALSKTAAMPTIGTWTDNSGRVEVTVYTASATSIYNSGVGCQIGNVSTQVENDRVLVGGGAWVDYGSGGAGAFLTQAYPADDALTTFSAKSKDHGPSNSHTLHVHAIGLRLKGDNGAWIPRETLKGYMEYRTFTTTPSEVNSASVQNNVNYWTIGGGARVQWSSKGQLLTASAPSDNQPGWYAFSKSHRSLESCPLTAYAIGITKGSIPGFGTVDIRIGSTNPLQYFIKSPGTFVSYGKALDTFYSEPGWATTGFGARSLSTNGRGRLLTGLKLSYADNLKLKGESLSKDHFVNESGTTYSYILEIKKQ